MRHRPLPMTPCPEAREEGDGAQPENHKTALKTPSKAPQNRNRAAAPRTRQTPRARGHQEREVTSFAVFPGGLLPPQGKFLAEEWEGAEGRRGLCPFLVKLTHH